jgi:phosphoribosylformylglycinamidine cyclo-ligase
MGDGSGLSYRDAGVDIDAAQDALDRARTAIEAARGDDAVGSLGGFGGLFRMPEGLEEPLLCASTDGVGTKIAVAVAAKRHDTVGEDLVNHCVNDILVQGARPLFLLDYVATGRLKPGVVANVIEGFARGCTANGCALLGGETAEMPGTYKEGDYDLAATVVGVVERKALLPREGVAPGDLLVGLRSNGLHTNGYSLARMALFEAAGFEVGDTPEELQGATIADALLAVHRTYAPLLLPILEQGLVKALAHITGGGLIDNLPRVLPEGVVAAIDTTAWEVPPLFRLIQMAGRVDERECFRVFNMGIGMVAVVAPEDLAPFLNALEDAGERNAVIIGGLEPGDRGVRLDGLPE